MDILIFGCSSLTRSLAPGLAEGGCRITVLDHDEDRLARLARAAGVDVVVTAEPLLQDYLQTGGIDSADVLLAFSDDDHKNALVAQIAHHIFNVPGVFCLLEDPGLREFYRSIGLNTVDTGAASLENIRQYLAHQVAG